MPAADRYLQCEALEAGSEIALDAYVLVDQVRRECERDLKAGEALRTALCPPPQGVDPFANFPGIIYLADRVVMEPDELYWSLKKQLEEDEKRRKP